MFLKVGELLDTSKVQIQSASSVLADQEINERFLKFAKDLKKLTPKSEDFLYFSTRYITAAEASLINEDGSSKIGKNGQPLTAQWEVLNNGGIKWVCSDPTVLPVKNANGDIFPEEELIKAHKKWTGKPLCIDHKSDSVDAVRGIILDSYYDRARKYAVALIALDKVSFPELARGVQSGYKTSVSMGTRVARAICYDCGTVASTEREFCDHMRQKRAWGEINTGLDPIEISLVVSGADPEAKIRTVLAAADTLRASLDAKEEEINKISSEKCCIDVDKFKSLEDDLKALSDKLLALKENFKQEEKPVDQHDAHDTPALTDQNKTASNNNALRSELQELTLVVNSKFKDMEKSLETLSHTIKEEIMSVNSKDGMNKEGYFQGAGGISEPAPHQVKYPKDPTNENLREHGDKQMVGTHNMGSTDSMVPGDKEKKELVQRAEVEERALRRAAALTKAKENLMKQKEAYWQSGNDGGPGEPTPGKPKYPKDALDGKDRLKEDKQMVGKKPFPDVGDVDGLYGDDEKKKKLLQRASLKAKFVRVAGEDGTQDMGQSGWEVKRDDEVLFTATVDEISGGNVEGLYDVIASKEFATKMLEKVYKLGTAKAATIYKGAQAAPVMEPMPAPEAAPPAAPVMEAPSAPAADASMGTDKQGDPKEVALKLAEEMRDRASDLLEAVRVLTGEQAEMGELEGLSEKAASKDFRSLVKAKKTLNALLVAGMKNVIGELNDHQEEMSLISDMLMDDGNATNYTNTIVEEAFVDGQNVVAEARDLMSCVVKYAHGSEQLAKRAQKLEHGIDDMSKAEDLDFSGFGMDLPEEEESDEEREENHEENHRDHDEDYDFVEDQEMNNDEDGMGDINDVMMDVDPASLQGKKVEIKASLSTKEARNEFRAKLAAESVVFSPMLDEAHDLADGNTHFDVKPSDELGKVETIEERHKKMLEVAEAPPKVRKEATRLNDLIKAGKVSVAELDGLVAKGLDAEVVKYWKQFFGQAGKEGAEFATELLKEHAKAQVEEAINTHKVKIARAYELANEMVRRGLIGDERSVITAQVNDIMNYNDEGFDAMKRVVNKTPLRKQASLPQVGVVGYLDQEHAKPEVSFQEALDAAFAGRKY